MFDIEIKRRLISNKLLESDQKLVANFVHENALGDHSQEADMMMRDLDCTRVQRSVVMMNLYHCIPTMHSDLDHLHVDYNLKTSAYLIRDTATGDTIAAGTLY